MSGMNCLKLLDLQRESLNQLLANIGEDRDLGDLRDFDDFGPVFSLLDALRALPHVGQTTATKLVARKRPRLVPIVDGVIRRHGFGE